MPALCLDSRSSAHAGRACRTPGVGYLGSRSIGIHFLDDGFSIEIYEADGPLHISGTMGQHSSVKCRNW